jgi:hypothetical protein
MGLTTQFVCCVGHRTDNRDVNVIHDTETGRTLIIFYLDVMFVMC